MASRDISIFAKPASYKRTVKLPRPHLVRGSSMIRGEQIADYLGCKFNPEGGYENDLCIYIKPNNLEDIKDGDWVDVVDGDHIVRMLDSRPKINAIVNGLTSYELYKSTLKNKTAVIPPHHCNFDRELRTRKEVTTVGYIGGEIVFHYDFEEMKKLIEGIGLDFIYCCDYRSREEVVDFYRKIDIQVVWSRRQFRYQSRGPTKFINAASFGIPTVGFPQLCCQEVEGYYIKAETIENLLSEISLLKSDSTHYKFWSAKAIPMTEQYHISNITSLYRGLI